MPKLDYWALVHNMPKLAKEERPCETFQKLFAKVHPEDTSSLEVVKAEYKHFTLLGGEAGALQVSSKGAAGMQGSSAGAGAVSGGAGAVSGGAGAVSGGAAPPMGASAGAVSGGAGAVSGGAGTVSGAAAERPGTSAWSGGVVGGAVGQSAVSGGAVGQSAANSIFILPGSERRIEKFFGPDSQVARGVSTRRGSKTGGAARHGDGRRDSDSVRVGATLEF